MFSYLSYYYYTLICGFLCSMVHCSFICSYQNCNWMLKLPKSLLDGFRRTDGVLLQECLAGSLYFLTCLIFHLYLIIGWNP